MNPIPSLPTVLLLHPELVQLATGLLLVTPLFIVLGAVLPPLKGRPYTMLALILMGLGTAGLWLAAPLDPVAAGSVSPDTAIHEDAAMVAHQNLAGETRIIFAGLLILYVGVILIPYVVHQPESRLLSTALPLAFLILYCAGGVFLVNIAYRGPSAAQPAGISRLGPSRPASVARPV